MKEHALVLGKFMDFHKGHEALIKYAQSLAKKVTVLLCVTPDDRVLPRFRKAWIEGTFGKSIELKVFPYLDEDLDGGEESDRGISEQWAKYVDRAYPTVDLLVGSEDYVRYMADYGSFDYNLYDPGRTRHDCSSTSVSKGEWHFRAREAKYELHKRVFLVGPESSGKTQAARALYADTNHSVVWDGSRDIMNPDGSFCKTDLKKLALAQEYLLLEALDHADSSVIVSDSSALTTKVYSDMMFGHTDELIENLLYNESETDRDIYIVFTPEVEWVDDVTRHMSSLEDRWDFFNRTINWLRSNNREHFIVDGDDYEDRIDQTFHYMMAL